MHIKKVEFLPIGLFKTSIVIKQKVSIPFIRILETLNFGMPEVSGKDLLRPDLNQVKSNIFDSSQSCKTYLIARS